MKILDKWRLEELKILITRLENSQINWFNTKDLQNNIIDLMNNPNIKKRKDIIKKIKNNDKKNIIDTLKMQIIYIEDNVMKIIRKRDLNYIPGFYLNYTSRLILDIEHINHVYIHRELP